MWPAILRRPPTTQSLPPSSNPPPNPPAPVLSDDLIGLCVSQVLLNDEIKISESAMAKLVGFLPPDIQATFGSSSGTSYRHVLVVTDFDGEKFDFCLTKSKSKEGLFNRVQTFKNKYQGLADGGFVKFYWDLAHARLVIDHVTILTVSARVRAPV